MAGFDSELDALFKSSAGASQVASIKPHSAAVPIAPNPSAKRKHEKNVSFADQQKSKRSRAQKAEKGKKGKKETVDSSDEENEPAAEAGHQRSTSSVPKPRSKMSQKPVDSDAELDLDAPPPIHESLLAPSGKPSGKKKFVPEDETSEQRDARTIFVGNLSASAANNVARKALQKHILRHLASVYPDSPQPTIESSRFRSIAFKSPTSKLPSDALSVPKPSKSTTSSEHHRARAAEWRATHDPEAGAPHKTFQTPAQKKKTAFITGALHHSGSSSASAYVVFAYPRPIEGQEPPWDPAEVASRAVIACNGSVFMDRTLRVDRVRAKGAATTTDKVEGVEKADPRTMVFVGNLDFEVHEDAVRELFEKLVEKERGATVAETAEKEVEGSDEEESGSNDEEDAEGSDHSDDESEDESGDESEGEPSPPLNLTQVDSLSSSVPQPGHGWVKSVRIIRDKDTQLGKGFAYVQFYDRVSADEILAMEPGTIKLAKRKLRIQRCKTLPGVTLPKPKPKERPPITQPHTAKSNKPSAAPRQTSTRSVPHAYQTLGDRIRSLSKDERKVVKSSDADRVARRLSKKKARVAMERGARKAAGKKESILGGRPGGKSRVGKSSKTKRERSDKAILKKNVKK
ncbi:hypothetical protein FRC09_015483 [Ceratobasidium sp. 395]|nr:hypothetical protein FRC09_015483 [Ceratobasidium sp. 395]